MASLAKLAEMPISERATCELTTGAVAEILGISRRQVTRLCERGALPAVRGVALTTDPGTREATWRHAGTRGNRRADWRIPVAALLAALAQQLDENGQTGQMDEMSA